MLILDQGKYSSLSSLEEKHFGGTFMLTRLYHILYHILKADWLRGRAFFLNHKGTFGNQEGMIT